MSRFRPDPQSRYRAPLGQLELPLDFEASERAARLRNREQSRPRRSRLSPARVAKYQEIRERRGIEQELCPQDSEDNLFRQRHHFVLTPTINAYQ